MGFPDDYKDRVRRINERLMGSLDVMEEKRLREAMAHYPAAGGKRLRPLLATMVSEAVGGKADAAMPFGVALEMVHNFTLVHDDVMDEDDTRRGLKTVHSLYGVPEAILAGDAMFARAFEMVLESDSPSSDLVELTDILARSVRLLAEGQQMDMDFERREEVSSDEYLKMIERKTAVLYSAAAQGGAIAGGGTEAQQEALFEYGRLIGLAFQIWDDVLDLRSDQKTFGKPVLNDIRNGKKTLIAVHALENLRGREREEFLAVLGKKDAEEKELRRARDILEAAGSVDHASRVSMELVAKAKDRLGVLKDSVHKDALRAFADYMVARKT
ncbi:MAG: polyprenyl synthetase family protein [Candidatus Thermoplasmatota archaeon]